MIDRHALEKLEVLDGSRNSKARRRAAVRLEDLEGLLALPPLKATKAAGSTPTQAEFNALVEDVQAIHNRLKALHDALQARILP